MSVMTVRYRETLHWTLLFLHWTLPYVQYLFQVLSCHTATEKVTDANDHSVLNLSRCTIYKKLLPKKEIYVLPEWIFYPDIPVRENIELRSSDYQFLCDCV